MCWRIFTIFACLIGIPVFSIAGEEPEASIAEQLRAIPVPEKTPFDDDAKQREDYLHKFREGYFWAQGKHFVCPTNPADHNLHAIRGWVEGWQAGVAAGGAADLPAKYAAYLRWDDTAALPGKAVENPRDQLTNINSNIRAAAAKELQASYVPPDRKAWDELLAATKIGDTKQQLHARLTDEQAKCESGIGTGPNYMEVYRLDDRWLLKCWFRLEGDVLFEFELQERMREVWVAPPKEFNGPWITYFVSGAPAHEIEYLDGQYHGQFVAFHPQGGRSYVQHYRHGEAEGWDTGYHPSGRISYQGLYQGGKQVGVWTWYDEDGTVRDTSQHPEPTGKIPDAPVSPPADGQAANKPPLQPQPALRPPAGILVGRFVFDGDPPQPQPIPGINRDGYEKLRLLDESLLVGPDGGIKNILVWISDKNVPIPPRPPVKRLPAQAQLTFKAGVFQPRVLAYEAWRGLLIQNDELVSTNAHWQSPTDGMFNALLPPGISLPFETPPQKLPSPVVSNIHHWTKTFLFPCAHPYFAVTNDKGDFRIERIPPGKWEFRAWHERWGYIAIDEPASRPYKFSFDIQPGGNDLGNLKIRPSQAGDSAAALPGEREPTMPD